MTTPQFFTGFLVKDERCWTLYAFDYLDILTQTKLLDEFVEALTILIIDHLPPMLWCKDDVILVIPFRMSE